MGEGLLTVAGITTIVVIIFTLLFQYFPGLRVWWGGQKTEVKKLIILALYIVVGAIVAFGGCLQSLRELLAALSCYSPAQFLEYVIGTLIAVGAGQGVFALMPELNDVREARAMRAGTPPVG
jgi:hypothetical protein